MIFFSGIEDLQRSHFEKRFDEDLEEFYYAEIQGGFSKNHRDDDEGSRDERGATIAFRTSEDGFNAGEFIDDQQKFSRRDNKFFFQKHRQNKQFNIHDPNEQTYYENQKVGKNLVASMLPKVRTFTLESKMTRF